jgi:hypothetical protein
MELSPENRSIVASWVESGKKLAEIQKDLESELGIRMTYMEVRFLVDDLNLELKAEGPVFSDPAKDLSNSQPAEPGKVSVTLDKITKPGALVSGGVVFSDGVKAQWHLDQTGRLSLNPSTPGYKPSPDDVQAFQTELQNAVEASGMF